MLQELLLKNDKKLNWIRSKELLSERCPLSISTSDNTSQVKFHQNFGTYLLLDNTFKSTFQVSSVIESQIRSDKREREREVYLYNNDVMHHIIMIH